MEENPIDARIGSSSLHRPLLELGCWVNDIGADGRKIGNK